MTPRLRGYVPVFVSVWLSIKTLDPHLEMLCMAKTIVVSLWSLHNQASFVRHFIIFIPTTQRVPLETFSETLVLPPPTGWAWVVTLIPKRLPRYL
jgi:hypothetical protein